MTNRWGGSRGVTIALLGALCVLGSVAGGGSTTALGLTWLRTGLPSTNTRLTRTTILRRTRSATVVGNVTVTLGLTVGTRENHASYLCVGGVTGAGWGHAWLTIAHHATSARRREVAARRIVHRAVHVATRDTSSSGLLHADLVTLSDLALQLLPADLTTLGEGDVERLGANHLVVHLCDSFRGFFGTGVTNETEALGMVLVVAHDFGTGDGSEGLELGTELFIIDIVVEILDVEVDSLILAQLLHFGLFVRLL